MVMPSKPTPRRRTKPPAKPAKAKRPGFFARLFGGLFAARFKPDAARYRAYQSRQTVLRMKAGFGDFGTAPELHQRLRKLGLDPQEAVWSFYVPPSPRLHKRIPLLSEIYGPQAGVKILKDFQPPEDAIYATDDLALDGRRQSRQMTPSPTALLRVAGLLHVAGLGPRVHDLVHLRAGGMDLSAYVVDHLPWGVSEPSAYRAFMARLRPVLRAGLIATAQGGKPEADTAFAATDCNGNLMLDPTSGEPLYVDFQTFHIPDELQLITTFAKDALPHAGGDKRRLHQSIPGAMPGLRDTETRARAIAELMRKPNLKMDNRLVFDLGCNNGLMMAEALAMGALWAYGWDHGIVAQGAARILAAMGASRSTVFGETLQHDTDVAGMLPMHHRLHSDGVLFHLDVEREIGFPPGVAHLPWRFLLFEGQPGEQVGPAWRRIQHSGWIEEGGVLAHTLYADDGGEPRPLLLAQRRA